jgi:hypothetical protein
LAVLKESGDVILSKAENLAEAGEILGGAKSPPVGQTTIFNLSESQSKNLAAAQIVFNGAPEKKAQKG